MSDMATIVLSDVEERHGSNDKGPWTKYSLKDGNGQVVGSTFAAPIGDAAKSLIGQRIVAVLAPARDPKFPPTVTAIRPAPEEEASSNGKAELSKEEWLLKDRAADKRACIAIAASSLTHTLKSEPSEEDLRAFAGRVLRMAQIFADAVARQRGIDIDAETPIG